MGLERFQLASPTTTLRMLPPPQLPLPTTVHCPHSCITRRDARHCLLPSLLYMLHSAAGHAAGKRRGTPASQPRSDGLSKRPRPAARHANPAEVLSDSGSDVQSDGGGPLSELSTSSDSSHGHSELTSRGSSSPPPLPRLLRLRRRFPLLLLCLAPFASAASERLQGRCPHACRCPALSLRTTVLPTQVAHLPAVITWWLRPLAATTRRQAEIARSHLLRSGSTTTSPTRRSRGQRKYLLSDEHYCLLLDYVTSNIGRHRRVRAAAGVGPAHAAVVPVPPCRLIAPGPVQHGGVQGRVGGRAGQGPGAGDVQGAGTQEGRQAAKRRKPDSTTSTDAGPRCACACRTATSSAWCTTVPHRRAGQLHAHRDS